MPKRMIKILCAWCGEKIGKTPGKDGPTHGVCPPCKEIMELPLGAPVPEKHAERWKLMQKRMEEAQKKGRDIKRRVRYKMGHEQ